MLIYPKRLSPPILVHCSNSSLKQYGYKSLSEALKDTDNVYIDCKKLLKPGTFDSYWMNPYSKKDNGISLYYMKLFNDKEMLSRITELEGKKLLCWCEGSKCHGKMLLSIFDSLTMISDVALDKFKKEN